MQGSHAGGLLMPDSEIIFEAVLTPSAPKTANSYASFFRKHPYVSAAGVVATAAAAVTLNVMFSSEEDKNYTL